MCKIHEQEEEDIGDKFQSDSTARPSTFVCREGFGRWKNIEQWDEKWGKQTREDVDWKLVKGT